MTRRPGWRFWLRATLVSAWAALAVLAVVLFLLNVYAESMRSQARAAFELEAGEVPVGGKLADVLEGEAMPEDAGALAQELRAALVRETRWSQSELAAVAPPRWHPLAPFFDLDLAGDLRYRTALLAALDTGGLASAANVEPPTPWIPALSSGPLHQLFVDLAAASP